MILTNVNHIHIERKFTHREQIKIFEHQQDWMVEFYFVNVHFMLEMGMIEETSFMAPWLLG